MPLGVGHFDADRVLAGNRGHDAHAGHAQGDRQVVGQAGDLRQPQAGFELDLELGDHRAGLDLDDFDAEAEIEERLFQNLGLAADFLFVLLVADLLAFAAAGRSTAARTAAASSARLAASSSSITSSRSLLRGRLRRGSARVSAAPAAGCRLRLPRTRSRRRRRRLRRFGLFLGFIARRLPPWPRSARSACRGSESAAASRPRRRDAVRASRSVRVVRLALGGRGGVPPAA